MLSKTFDHLIEGDMQRRRQYVTGFFLPQLDNIFAEIGFDHLETTLLERCAQFYLLGHHRLALGDKPGIHGRA